MCAEPFLLASEIKATPQTGPSGCWNSSVTVLAWQSNSCPFVRAEPRSSISKVQYFGQKYECEPVWATIATMTVMDGQTAWCQCGAERPAGLAARGIRVMQASHSVQNKVSVRLHLLPLPSQLHTHTRVATWLYFQNQEPFSPSLWALYGQQAITELTSRMRCSVADSWIDHWASLRIKWSLCWCWFPFVVNIPLRANHWVKFT